MESREILNKIMTGISQLASIYLPTSIPTLKSVSMRARVARNVKGMELTSKYVQVREN
jgi:hypothetical protein